MEAGRKRVREMMEEQKDMTLKEEKHIFTVSELTQNIRMILEGTFREIWVEGEVSNFTKHTSGHMYFSLKDDSAVLACVLFRSVNQGIKFKIENGMHVICFGRISVYDKRGQYQLYVDKLEPAGVGALQLAFEQMVAKLSKEGLFGEAHKKILPLYPMRIGILNSVAISTTAFTFCLLPMFPGLILRPSAPALAAETARR